MYKIFLPRKSFVFGTGSGLTEDEVRMRDTSDFDDVLLFCPPRSRRLALSCTQASDCDASLRCHSSTGAKMATEVQRMPWASTRHDRLLPTPTYLLKKHQCGSNVLRHATRISGACDPKARCHRSRRPSCMLKNCAAREIPLDCKAG